MIEPSLLLLFLGALVVIYISPGPDMTLILAVSASKGTHAGFGIIKGVAVARAVHVLCSGLGLAVLFATYPGLQHVVRIVGAIYLLHWAWKIIKTPINLSHSTGNVAITESDVMHGFFTNLLNPKAILFCSMLLPQFISPQKGGIIFQFLQLGGVLILVGLLFDSCFVLFADWFMQRLGKKMAGNIVARSRMEKIRNYMMVIVLGCIAVFLLTN